MRKRKNKYDDLQMEFNFMNDVTDMSTHRDTVHATTPCRGRELPMSEEGEQTALFKQIDWQLKHISNSEAGYDSRLKAFILRSFYTEGKSVMEIAHLISEGVEGVPCVTRERVRMIVSEIRQDLLSMSSSRKHSKGFIPRMDLVERMTEYAAHHTGHVIKDRKWLTCPRLGAIAFLLHKKVITGDTVIPWVKTEKILIDENIEKRVFNAYYASLFRLLQKEVRPMTYDAILRDLPDQRQMKGREVREDLLRVILRHDEVFEEVADDVFQLCAEHLNMTQRVARIIFEEKDITPSELQRIYTERHRDTFSGPSSAGKAYPWCVPVGKSKWVYREDGIRLRVPAALIRDFCKEHVRFTLQEVNECLESQGIHINKSSVRCYIMRDCRPLNSDGNTFCLTSEIPESEKHLWRSKYATTTRLRTREWKSLMAEEIRRILESAPSRKMRKNDVLHQCKHILEQEGIVPNNFYKFVNSLTWLKSTCEDGKTYLEMDT